MPRAAVAQAQPPQTFTLFTTQGRVYASNVRHKVIDLGWLRAQGDGFAYELDGNHTSGHSLPTADAALQNIAKGLTFLFVDGQFTAVRDLGDRLGPHLAEAHLQVILDPLGRCDPAMA